MAGGTCPTAPFRPIQRGVERTSPGRVHRLWRITRKDGQQFFFTDHDRHIAFGGDTYRADAGFARTAIRSDAGFAVDNLDLVGVFAEGGIVEDEVRAGLFDGAEIRVSFVNWQDPDGHGEILLRRGTLGETRLTPQGYEPHQHAPGHAVRHRRGHRQQHLVGGRVLPGRADQRPVRWRRAARGQQRRLEHRVLLGRRRAPGARVRGFPRDRAVSYQLQCDDGHDCRQHEAWRRPPESRQRSHVERLGFFVNAALAANVRGVIYEVDGSNGPTNLVAVSNQITSLRRGWNEVVFSLPPAMAAGQSYWIGFITDTSFVYRPSRHGDTPAASNSESDTYADGPADPFGTASALGNNVPVYVIVSQAIPPAVGDSGKASIVIAITS